MRDNFLTALLLCERRNSPAARTVPQQLAFQLFQTTATRGYRAGTGQKRSRSDFHLDDEILTVWVGKIRLNAVADIGGLATASDGSGSASVSPAGDTRPRRLAPSSLWSPPLPWRYRGETAT